MVEIREHKLEIEGYYARDVIGRRLGRKTIASYDESIKEIIDTRVELNVPDDQKENMRSLIRIHIYDTIRGSYNGILDRLRKRKVLHLEKESANELLHLTASKILNNLIEQEEIAYIQPGNAIRAKLHMPHLVDEIVKKWLERR